MDPLLVALGVVGILVGLVGVVLPVLPGSLVVWVATAGTLLLHRPDAVALALTVGLGALSLAGSLATLVLPTRTGWAGGASRSSFALAAVGGVLGFFLLPVLGFLIGALAGLVVGEWRRLGEWRPAWGSTLRVLGSYGIGVLVELGVALVMVAVWVTAVVVRA